MLIKAKMIQTRMNNILEELNQENMAIRVEDAEKRLERDIKRVKEATTSIVWTSLAVSTMSELIDNLWELKNEAQSYLNKCRTNKIQANSNIVEIANKTIDYYSLVRHKLNRLKTEIFNYNRRFPNNQIKNIEGTNRFKN